MRRQEELRFLRWRHSRIDCEDGDMGRTVKMKGQEEEGLLRWRDYCGALTRQYLQYCSTPGVGERPGTVSSSEPQEGSNSSDNLFLHFWTPKLCVLIHLVFDALSQQPQDTDTSPPMPFLTIVQKSALPILIIFISLDSVLSRSIILPA